LGHEFIEGGGVKIDSYGIKLSIFHFPEFFYIRRDAYTSTLAKHRSYLSALEKETNELHDNSKMGYEEGKHLLLTREFNGRQLEPGFSTELVCHRSQVMVFGWLAL